MKNDKRYIVRKYVMARSVKQAIKKEKEIEADDCWLDENFIKDNSDKVGFSK